MREAIEVIEVIDNYKKNTKELKFNLNKIENKLNENIHSNKKLLSNNNEFKNTINHYIDNNKKLQNKQVIVKI